MKKALILDMDGTLNDSFYAHQRNLAVVAQIAHKDIPLDPDNVNACFSIEKDTIDHELVRRKYQITMDPEEIERLTIEDFLSLDRRFLFHPFPGIKDFIKKAKERGLKLVLASISPKEWVYSFLEQADILAYFDLVVSGEKVQKKKPDPEIYLKVLTELALSAEECLVIEDSLKGIRAARAAGIDVVAYKGSKIIQDTSLANDEFFDYRQFDLNKY